MSYFEFPHTRTYDSDLGWLIKAVDELKEKLNSYIEFNTIKFADPINWDITKQYEANTIVIDNLGNGYISRKAVPEGIALSNSDYWVEVAAFGGMIENLMHQISSADEESSRTATVDRHIGDLVWLDKVLYRCVAEISAGDAYVDGSNVEHVTIEGLLNDILLKLDNERTSRESADTYLTQSIDEERRARENAVNYLTVVSKKNEIKINNAHWIFIGDSYNYGANSEGDRLRGWGERIIDKLGLTGSYSKGSDGAAFMGNSYLGILQALETEEPDLDKESISNIMICGGYNDAILTPSQIEEGAQNFANYVKENYPNAKLHLGCIGRARNNTTRQTQIHNTALLSFKKCAKYGYSFINNSNLVFHTYNNWQVDNVHPNEAGQEEISDNLLLYILNNSLSIHNVTSAVSGNANLTLSAYSQMDDNTISIDILSGRYTPVAPISVVCTGNNPIDLGSVSGGYISSSIGFYNGTAATVMLHDTSGYYVVTGSINIGSDNHLYLYLNETSDNHVGYLSLSSVDVIDLLTPIHLILNAETI